MRPTPARHSNSLGKVLVVSNCMPQVCLTQALLHGAGVAVAAATNIDTAFRIGSTALFDAVVVCRGSFSEEDRENLILDLQQRCPRLNLVVGCLGCTVCEGSERDRKKMAPLSQHD